MLHWILGSDEGVLGAFRVFIEAVIGRADLRVRIIDMGLGVYGFADVRNHLATRQLIEMMGTDLFVFHGFTEFFLDGKWVIATLAFNRELCERHKVIPLEFNGREDSIFQPYNTEKKQFMEYVNYYGSFADIPVELIVAGWEKAYGIERVRNWINGMERSGGKSRREFLSEEVITI